MEATTLEGKTPHFFKPAPKKYEAAAHSDPRIAIIRALTEIAQNRAANLYEHGIHGAAAAGRAKVRPDKRLLEELGRVRREKKIKFSKIPDISQADIRKKLTACIDLLVKQGFEVLFKELQSLV